MGCGHAWVCLNSRAAGTQRAADAWRGYFVLRKDALWSPEDRAASYTLLFDTMTWTPIEPEPAVRFRGVRARSTLTAPAFSPSHTMNETEGKEMDG